MEKNDKLIRYSMQLAYLRVSIPGSKRNCRKIIKYRLTSLLILNRVM